MSVVFNSTLSEMASSDNKGRRIPSAAHEEFADLSDQVLHSDVRYDAEGIRGMFRSPYVLGAAILASFGGFSFGYGQTISPLSLH